MNYALQKSRARSARSRWMVIGSLVALVGIIAIAAAIGVTVAKKSKSAKSAASGSSSSSGSSGSSNDPSNFAKDSNLHQSFSGLAYTPKGSLYPQCGNSLEDVIKDVQLMSQLTTRVRLYGADCNQTQLVLEAIKQTKVDMTVFIGNYVEPSDDASYKRQRDTLMDAINTYGTTHIAGCTVGNEFMLNYLNLHGGGTDPNDAVGQQGAAELLTYINDTRSTLSQANIKIPIGNSDAGSYFNTEVLENVDYGMANVHAWFANQTASNGANWVFNFFQTNNVQPAAALPNQPKMYIAETGWPTGSKDAGNESNGPSNASVSNLQIYLDNFVCQANQNNVPYFYFEFFDEEWKDATFGGVEGHWGLFTSNRTLKDIKIPNCQ